MKDIKFKPIKTEILMPPKIDIFDLLKKHLKLNPIKEKDIIFITSKILSLHQGRCIDESEIKNKDELIIKEADYYIPREKVPNSFVVLTIKDNVLIPSSGIDRSNANNYYILWPKEVNNLLYQIKEFIKKEFGINDIGIIATDSRSNILKLGITGTCIGCVGVRPLIDKRRSLDIFNRELKMTKVNMIESLSNMAVLLMGEADEQTPLLIASGDFNAEFVDRITYDEMIIEKEKDIYSPLLDSFIKKD